MTRNKSKAERPSESSSDDIEKGMGKLSVTGSETQCSGIKKNGTGACTRSGYPEEGQEVFLCQDHTFQKRGQIMRDQRKKLGKRLKPTFTRQDNPPSTDIRARVCDEENERVIFPGWQFDMLTLGYNSDIKKKIRKVIEDYFTFVGQSKGKALKESRGQHKQHLGRGCVYMFTLEPSEDEYERMDPGDRLKCKKGVLIKIGYTANLKQRLDAYEADCGKKVRSGPIETFPETPIDAEEDFGGLGFALLLEKILHQIWTIGQYDIHCICGRKKDEKKKGKMSDVATMKCHTEVFLFERGEHETRKDAFNDNIRFMKPHILKWVNAIESLDDLHQELKDFHNQKPGDSGTGSRRSNTKSEGSTGRPRGSGDGSEEFDMEPSITSRKKEKERSRERKEIEKKGEKKKEGGKRHQGKGGREERER